MVVLWGGAVSYERGTPVILEGPFVDRVLVECEHDSVHAILSNLLHVQGGVPRP